MFDKWKLKRNLVNLTKSYKQLDIEYKTYLTKRNPNKMLDKAIQSKFKLELNRLAILYDTLKESYFQFELIKSSSDFWKFDKPELSEGTMFNIHKSTYVPSSVKLTSYYLGEQVSFDTSIERINNSKVKPFLKKALTHHTTKQWQKKNLTYLSDHNYEGTVETAILIKALKAFRKEHSIALPEFKLSQDLELAAKQAKINVIGTTWNQ